MYTLVRIKENEIQYPVSVKQNSLMENYSNQMKNSTKNFADGFYLCEIENVEL